MSNLIFPMNLPGMTPKVIREPYFKTSVQEALSGSELRVSWWSAPRWKYTLEFEFLRTYGTFTEVQSLLSVLFRHMGQWDSFLFADPEGNAVTAMPFGVGTGAKTIFQLQTTLVPSADLPAAASRKYYPTAGDGYEPIQDLNGSPSIYVNGVLKTLTTDYTISSTGVVTFNVAPSNGLVVTWTGSYYRRVRLVDDGLPSTQFVKSFWESKTLKLISVR